MGNIGNPRPRVNLFRHGIPTRFRYLRAPQCVTRLKKLGRNFGLTRLTLSGHHPGMVQYSRGRILTAYRAGSSAAEIAEAQGISASTVYRELRRAEEGVRRTGPRSGSAWHERARRLRAGGLSYAEIARRLGLSRQRVWEVVTRQHR